MIDQLHRARGRFDAAVELNRKLCREHFLLRLRIDADGPAFPATRPGQFVQLGCRPLEPADDHAAGHELTWSPDAPPVITQQELCRNQALLRRPFSLAGRADDARGTTLDVIHRVVGKGTAYLAEMNVGDPIDLIGPLGNAFELPAGKSLGLLVGGGVGLPPMFYLAEAMRHAGWDAIGFVGAMTQDLLAVTARDDVLPDPAGAPSQWAEEFARHGYPSVVTTDDGSLGLAGRITDGLRCVIEGLSTADRERAVVYTCGPEPMMHAIAEMAKASEIECQVCLEQAMACGMGTCQSCIVRIEERDDPHGHLADGRAWRYRLACTDGPVFPAEDVIWS